MVAKVICILNEKGGVGKTTISLHLSKILSDAKSWKVLSIDNDPQGNFTNSLLVDSTLSSDANIYKIYDDEVKNLKPMHIKKNLDLIGADSTLSRKLSSSDIEIIYKMHDAVEKFKEDYDYIIIDCLPSFGQLNMAALMASDYIIIPVTPDSYAVNGLNSLLKKIDKVKNLKERAGESLEILGILLNMVEGRETVLQSQFVEELRNKYSELLFSNILVKSIKYSEAAILNKSIMEHDAQKIGMNFLKFVKECLMRMRKTNELTKVA